MYRRDLENSLFGQDNRINKKTGLTKNRKTGLDRITGLTG
jgi:hypothetical protein